MGDVPPQPQHDADVGPRRHAARPLTKPPDRAPFESTGGAGPDARPSPLRRAAFGLAALLAFLALVGLGTWQVERRAWKLDLIARVEARVHAPAVPAPGPADWAKVGPGDAYRHVRLSGTLLNAKETLVQAVTERGGGFWVLTPLRRADGSLVLVNRGFVPADHRAPVTREPGQLAGEVAVTGLLRLTEPGGAFLRSNDPRDGRWYSRDVEAIAAARGLADVAPYFVDADAAPNPGGLPVGGLTVIAFPNNHLVYAITWYGMALMLAGAVVHLLRSRRHPRPEGE